MSDKIKEEINDCKHLIMLWYLQNEFDNLINLDNMINDDNSYNKIMVFFKMLKSMPHCCQYIINNMSKECKCINYVWELAINHSNEELLNILIDCNFPFEWFIEQNKRGNNEYKTVLIKSIYKNKSFETIKNIIFYINKRWLDVDTKKYSIYNIFNSHTNLLELKRYNILSLLKKKISISYSNGVTGSSYINSKVEYDVYETKDYIYFYFSPSDVANDSNAFEHFTEPIKINKNKKKIVVNIKEIDECFTFNIL